MTWGEDWRARDEVTDMALVGRRDGRNFGYGRQLSYAGPQALKRHVRRRLLRHGEGAR